MRGTRTDARRRRHYRVRKQVRGDSARPRLTIFRSNKYIYAQLIDDDTGHTMAQASSREVDGPLSAEVAAKVGTAIGERAKDAGVDTVIFDRGGYAYHGRIKALADAARETGLKF